MNSSNFVKVDDNKIVNEKSIKWIKKMDECLEICTKTTGCTAKIDTHRICKSNNPSSYDKLNILFK